MSGLTCMLVTLALWWFGPTSRHVDAYYNDIIYTYYAYMSLSGWGTWLTHQKAEAGNKRMLMFVDDLNMPRTGLTLLCIGYHWRVEAWWKCSMFQILAAPTSSSSAWNKSSRKDLFGSQPPLELLRQWIDYGCWYDRLKQTLRPCTAEIQAQLRQTRIHILCCLYFLHVFTLSGTYEESPSMKKGIKRLQAAESNTVCSTIRCCSWSPCSIDAHRYVEGIHMVSAMGPPGGGRAVISSRLQSAANNLCFATRRCSMLIMLSLMIHLQPAAAIQDHKTFATRQRQRRNTKVNPSDSQIKRIFMTLASYLVWISARTWWGLQRGSSKCHPWQSRDTEGNDGKNPTCHTCVCVYVCLNLRGLGSWSIRAGAKYDFFALLGNKLNGFASEDVKALSEPLTMTTINIYTQVIDGCLAQPQLSEFAEIWSIKSVAPPANAM